MSNANITLVQGLYAAFGRGDIAALVAGASPDIDWVVNGSRSDFPTLGAWKGQAGMQQFFDSIAEHQDAKAFSPQEFFAADDRVFVLGHYEWTIRKTGRTVASDWVHVFTIRDGKVAKFREFNDTAAFAQAYRG
jgi:ketosteroid isomerase-like protein